MGMTITLPEDLADEVRRAASRQGQDAERYAISALRKAVNKPSLDEILAPFRKEFAESGMTEDEFDNLIEEARQEIWEEKQAKKADD
ncbi:MAG TPA: hypothetical protein VNO70_16655 [Blastocatellia bacterium]|nr:hypothetical protein [Blastocatellia bacterium]